MIQTEIIEGRIRHYSDENRRILQVETGVIYDDALDNMPCRYTYQETDEYIDTPDDEA